MAKSRRAPPSPPRRSYDGASRAEKTTQNRTKVIETYIRLLVAQRGGEVALEDVVQASGVSARSIFRFFADKANLSRAAAEHVESYVSASAQQLTTKSVPEFAEYVYAQFDAFENLTLAYIYSNFGSEARLKLRAKLDQLLVARILSERKLERTPERLKKLAVIVNLINAKLWHDIKTSFGISGEEIGPSIKNAVEILIADL